MSEAGSGSGLSPEQMQEAIAALSSPDTVESPSGGSSSSTACPRPDTVTTVYDALDLMRGIEVFLNAVPGRSLVAMRRGLRAAGVTSARIIGITEPRANSNSLFLTPNTETTYGTTFLDLRRGDRRSSRPRRSRCASSTTSGSATSPTWASPDRTAARAASTSSCPRTTTANVPGRGTSSTTAPRSPTGWCFGRWVASRR